MFQTDELLEEARSLQLHIRGLPRRVREWPLYRAVDERVVNMSTVLPLVGCYIPVVVCTSFRVSVTTERAYITLKEV